MNNSKDIERINYHKNISVISRKQEKGKLCFAFDVLVPLFVDYQYVDLRFKSLIKTCHFETEQPTSIDKSIYIS